MPPLHKEDGQNQDLIHLHQMLQACCVQQNQMGNHRNWSFSGLDHILRKHLCY